MSCREETDATGATGISMFVGIIAMISSVLVGTLGKEYLISVNAQMYGWSPTYSFSITGSDFQDTIKMENFFREIYNTDHFVAVTFSMLEEITVLSSVQRSYPIHKNCRAAF